ncbi:MAG TPA: branched-chain amino acid ABC transporter permease [Actinomycetes bacterium]|nr:branched-chain amino acid ABC transporter permease [Actinomycetes bacterium]
MTAVTPEVTDAGEGPSGRRGTAVRVWPPLGLAAVVAVLLLVWVGSNGYRQDLGVLAATYALIALGMYVPFIMAGSLSLAYSAYAGIGAYAVGVVSRDTGMPLWVGWLVAPLVSAVLAVVLGLATRRLSGFYLGSVTLLFATAFETWLVDADGITGGAGGIGGIRDLSVFGWEPDRSQQLVMATVLVLAVAFALDRLRQSPWGVLVRTMREVPAVVEASGVRVPVLKLVALAIGAAIASLGGCLFGSFVGGVTPETFTVNVVFLAIFMPLIGGAGTPWGAVVGALVVVELTLNFPAFSESGTLVLSLGVLVILLVAPRGLLGYLDEVRNRLASGPLSGLGGSGPGGRSRRG